MLRENLQQRNNGLSQEVRKCCEANRLAPLSDDEVWRVSPPMRQDTIPVSILLAPT